MRTVQKEFWIYQKRQNETYQWAVYVGKVWERCKPETVELGFTVYSEDIKTPTNSISTEFKHHDTATGYVNDLAGVISEFSTLYREDYNQLETEILRILLD